MPTDVETGNPTVAQRGTALYRARQAEWSTKTQVMRQKLAQREGDLRQLQSRSERLAQQLVLVERSVLHYLTKPINMARERGLTER